MKDSDKKFINYLALAFLASLAGYFSSGTFLSVLYYSHYWYLTAVLIATRRIVDNFLIHNENYDMEKLYHR